MADVTVLPAGIDITLAGRQYRVVAQGIGRIKRKLGVLLGVGGDGLTGEMDEQVHDALRTFIPDLAPVYSLLGYASEEEYKQEAEPDGAIEEVTVPQLLAAWDAIKTVNGGDRLERLGKALGLDGSLIRDVLQKEIAEISLQRSRSLRSPSGALDSPSSSTSEATSTEPSSLPSRSPDSSISSTPAVAA